MKRVKDSTGHFISFENTDGNRALAYAWDEADGEQVMYCLDQNILFADLLTEDLIDILRATMFGSDSMYAPEIERQNLQVQLEEYIDALKAEAKDMEVEEDG